MQPSATVIKDPTEQLIYEWDWSAYLASGVNIASQTFSVTVVHGAESPAALTFDNAAAVAGSPTQKFTMRLKGGTLGVKYAVTHQIVTDESPAQTAERSIFVLVEER